MITSDQTTSFETSLCHLPHISEHESIYRVLKQRYFSILGCGAKQKTYGFMLISLLVLYVTDHATGLIMEPSDVISMLSTVVMVDKYNSSLIQLH
jgi:hypothetical protein